MKQGQQKLWRYQDMVRGLLRRVQAGQAPAPHTLAAHLLSVKDPHTGQPGWDPHPSVCKRAQCTCCTCCRFSWASAVTAVVVVNLSREDCLTHCGCEGCDFSQQGQQQTCQQFHRFAFCLASCNTVCMVDWLAPSSSPDHMLPCIRVAPLIQHCLRHVETNIAKLAKFA